MAFEVVYVDSLAIALEIDPDTEEGQQYITLHEQDPEKAHEFYSLALAGALDLTHIDGFGVRFTPYVDGEAVNIYREEIVPASQG